MLCGPPLSDEIHKKSKRQQSDWMITQPADDSLLSPVYPAFFAYPQNVQLKNAYFVEQIEVINRC
jgi:hypothetical protein